MYRVTEYGNLLSMKRLIVILVPVFVVAAAFLLVFIYSVSSTTTAQPTGRLMSIESYVTQNISELSPEKEVLGGHFYVTEIQATDGKGVVHYEDGHIALVADFTYEATEQTGITITSFTIRE